MRIRAYIPRKLAPLLKDARYKGAHGGRGGGKSHFFAEQIVLKCYARLTRVACIREVQNSIRDSVRQLLIDKIQALNLGHCFDVFDTEIRGKDKTPAAGSLIVFKGMQSYNAENIKSLEGYDIAWVEEAQTLSDVSLRMLRPTLRKAGSELWFSWNPRHDSDAIDQFLRGPSKPSNAIVAEINWNDNPFLPEVLKLEKDADYAADPEMADHVWGGNYEIVSEGAYYARLIAEAEKTGRIGHFPPDPDKPVKTSWDLGVDDCTAIWFMQDDGRTVTVVDYYEVSGDGAPEIVAAAMPELNPDRAAAAAQMIELGRSHPFKYGTQFLPHDVKNREWGNGGRSRIEILSGLGVKNINIGVAANPVERIAATRKLLPIVRFNRTQRVEQGVKRLRRYRRKWNDQLQTFTTPLHDENSHGADAFGEYAINCGIYPPVEIKQPKPIETRQPTLDEIVKAQKFGQRSGRI